MSETTEQARELLSNAEATDQQHVTIPSQLLQTLVDQAELRGDDGNADALQRMDQALERWAANVTRQVGAMNRLIEQNRILQRRVAELQAGHAQ